VSHRQGSRALPIPRRAVLAATLALAGASLALPARAQKPDTGDWITTWAASPQPVWAADFFAPVGIPRHLRDQTVREIGRISLGGHRIRVVLSNEYGDAPLTIGAARVALSTGGAAIQSGTDHALTFNGHSSVTVPPGAPIVSDPVDLTVAPLSSVAVSLYFPDITPTTTWHNDGKQTAYITDGDLTTALDIHPTETTLSRIFLSGIMVDAPADARAIVTFGDSITDGDGSTPDADHRWPDFLADRLAKMNVPVAVVNEGISGARVLRDRMGDNALARFDRDVLSQPHVSTVILMMGINDIGWPDTLLVPKGEPEPTADDIITGYEQLIARAHAHNLRIIGATLTPFEDTFHGTPLFGYYSDTKEAEREAVNDWIRTSGDFDGVIDFDALVRDPADPRHINPQYDHGDHLHPNDAGYKVMAGSIDLGLLGIKQ